jgi:hypothetical protein
MSAADAKPSGIGEQLFTPPSIPVHLMQFPTIGGLVVPFVTLQHRNGQAALGLVDASRVESCLREYRCGVCGQVIYGRMVFLMREIDLARKRSSEPALCPPCAAYTQNACPMVGGYMAHYRREIAPFVLKQCHDDQCLCRLWAVPDASSARLGALAEQWYALWTLHYFLVRDSGDRLAADFTELRVLKLREIRRA